MLPRNPETTKQVTKISKKITETITDSPTGRRERLREQSRGKKGLRKQRSARAERHARRCHIESRKRAKQCRK